MSSLSIRRKALVFSPSASHPQDHGNRNRVFQTTSYLRDMGCDVHFILYPYENDWVNGIPPAAAEMRNAWSSFTVIPPSRPLHMPAAGEYHTIDEWWDPMIGNHLEWLFGREWFDIFVVNYTFFSKALEYAPRSTVKVLETHDLFTGRKELFLANGAAPEFFYTTADQEHAGLARADIIIGIKEREAEIIRGMAPSSEVISVPFFMPEKAISRRPERLAANSELRLGFIGALNTVNVLNLQRFLDRFEKYRTIYVPPEVSIIVAGEACSRLKSVSPQVNLMGRIERVKDFYDEVDVVVAPMTFSTGLKIKVGEALAYGKAVVATQDGFDGFPAVDPFHNLDDVDAVCRAIIRLAFDRERVALLERRTLLAAQLARSRSAEGYGRLDRAIASRSKRIVFITDQEIWQSDTVQQARLAQWCELCTHIAPCVIVYVGSKQVASFPADSGQLKRITEICECRGTLKDVLEVVDRITTVYPVNELVISAGGELGRQVWHGLEGRVPFITVDTWVPELAQESSRRNLAVSDLLLTSGRDNPDSGNVVLATSAFRYLPAGFDSWKRKRSSSSILIVLCRPDGSDALGLDQLLSVREIAQAAVVVDLCTDTEQIDSKAFGALKTHDIPRMVVVLGADRKGVEICRCLAAYWGIVCVQVSGGFPCILGDEICYTWREIADHVASCDIPGGNVPTHSGDAGWSTYWRMVSRRGARKRTPAAAAVTIGGIAGAAVM